MARKKSLQKRYKKGWWLTAFFTLFSAVYLVPIVTVLVNSFKNKNSITLSPFVLPNSDTFVGLNNYINGITHGNYPFYKSVFYSIII